LASVFQAIFFTKQAAFIFQKQHISSIKSTVLPMFILATNEKKIFQAKKIMDDLLTLAVQKIFLLTKNIHFTLVLTHTALLWAK
jgi:hypothetical protein